MNILIIGSKGFIGAHTLRHFKELKHTVFGCDVVVDYNSENYFLVDTANADFHEIFETQEFDVCINCSGAASVPDSLIHPQRDFELNVSNVFKMLDAIRKHQPECKFINISSAAVYGNPEILPVTEHSTLKPVSPYGLHKRMAENILQEFNMHYKIATLSLRLFSVFGPRLQKQLFWDLYKKMNENETAIELIGTGNESRDFIYVKDVTNAFDLIIRNCDFNGSAINVSNGIEVTIQEAVGTFAKELNWNGKINYSQKTRKGDPLNWKADITKLSQAGYQQKYSLQEGLKEYTQWLKEKI